jgi:hypothetical protein
MRQFIFTLLLPLSSFAQTISTNTNAWLHYMGTFQFHPKWSSSFETSIRGANVTQDFQQFFLRPSLDYKVSSRFTTSIGYTYVLTGVYGEPALNRRNMYENHAWIQGQLNTPIKKTNLTHRWRNESRWVFINEDEPYAYRNRMRYMLILNQPLAESPFSILAGNEVFLNIGKNAGKTLLNQNRVIAGLAYKFNPKNQIQLAYIHQTIKNFSNTIQENNATIRLSYVSRVELIKKRETPTLSPRLLSSL